MLVRATVALASIATTITAPILLLALRSAALLAVFCAVSTGEWAFLPPPGSVGLLSDPVAAFPRGNFWGSM